MAVFFCGGGSSTFCTPCHNDAMAGRNCEHDFKGGECTGGEHCPLGIPEHPKAGTVFPLGCSLCRSERVAQIQNNNQASAGVNLEERDDMLQRFGEYNGHDIDGEIEHYNRRVHETPEQRRRRERREQLEREEDERLELLE